MGPGIRRDDTRNACQDGDSDKVVGDGIKLYYRRSMSISVCLDRMASFSQGQIAKFIRGISVRQIRLGCGLVLFAYLVSHFLNHALGNISMNALATGVYYHAGFWQF